MKAPAERQDSRLMREMFHIIAPRYDFISGVLSFGMDHRWTRLGVAKASLPENAVVLDLACGTGDFSQLVLERLPRSTPIAADITERMLQLARASGLKDAVCSDAAALPFAADSFDCVFIGYGFCDCPAVKKTSSETHRV